MRWIIVAVSLAAPFVTNTTVALGAELGQRFESYTEMHLKSKYGALFFSDEPPYQHFAAINGDGELMLPFQDHYCFVLNHYDLQKGFANTLRTYRAKTTKWLGQIRSPPELFLEQYVPTADETSEQVTDYCIYGTKDVVRIEIQFGSNDGSSFDHDISFHLK